MSKTVSNFLSKTFEVFICEQCKETEPFVVLPNKAYVYTTGRHGHSKVNFSAKTYFTNRFFEDFLDSNTKVSPMIQSLDYALIEGAIIDGVFLSKKGEYVLTLRDETCQSWQITMPESSISADQVQLLKEQLKIDYVRYHMKDKNLYLYKIKTVYNWSESGQKLDVIQLK